MLNYTMLAGCRTALSLELTCMVSFAIAVPVALLSASLPFQRQPVHMWDLYLASTYCLVSKTIEQNEPGVRPVKCYLKLYTNSEN